MGEDAESTAHSWHQGAPTLSSSCLSTARLGFYQTLNTVQQFQPQWPPKPQLPAPGPAAPGRPGASSLRSLKLGTSPGDAESSEMGDWTGRE